MAHILIMPRQGNTVESCIITNWKVAEGDTVTPETAVCDVETDKASFEVPAGVGGTVLKLLHEPGDDVPVLRPIAVIGAAGEDWQNSVSDNISNESTQAPSEQVTVNSEQVTGNREQVTEGEPETGGGGQPAAISPRARNLALTEALPLESVHGTGPGGRIIERDVTEALHNRPALSATVKASGAGIPAAGSGIGGRVISSDLTDAAGQASPRPGLQTAGPDTFTETPIKGVRKIISERMRQSLAESAQFTLNMPAPAGKLLDFRSGIKAQESLAAELGLSKITINDLVLFALARTLPRFPYMNAHKTGGTIRTFNRLHLGLAVDTPRGLMVPVIRNSNLLSLAEISSEAKRLAGACQSGTVKPEELSGSTFTVSNLGSLGVTGFTPILNAPEVAILGVCGIELKPVSNQKTGQDSSLPVHFEPHIGFSLTIDHEAVDGAPAARFLKALCDAIAHIDLLLAAG
jgi:pyruvate dehydrogenase E2 component (dihydrolipoamide acetyltransferase)